MSTSPPPPVPQRRRRLRLLVTVLGSAAILLLLILVAAVIILPGSWFREKVRSRIVYEVEHATGGRVEIGEYRFDWTTLTAEVAPFTIHGTEPQGEAPLFRADSIRTGLRLVSLLSRDVDVASVRLERPHLNLLVDANGITNLPSPKIRRPDSNPIAQLVSLAIGEITLHNGELRYGDRRVPLNLHGRYLAARLAYDFRQPGYLGNLSMAEANASVRTQAEIRFSFEGEYRLLRNKLEVQSARISMKESSVQAAGTLEDFRSPNIRADLVARGYLAELGPVLGLPRPWVGDINFNGQLLWKVAEPLRLAGRITGQHFAIRKEHLDLRDVSLESDLATEGENAQFRNVTIHALNGIFRGAVDVENGERFRANGQLSGVAVASLVKMAMLEDTDLSGTIAGPVKASGSLRGGRRDLVANGQFRIEASQGTRPIRGHVDIGYNGRTGGVLLSDSVLDLPGTHLAVQGTPGERLAVRVESRDLKDLEAAVILASGKRPDGMPVELLPGGSATFDGSIVGPADRARVSGTLLMTAFRTQGQVIDSLQAAFDATATSAHVSSVSLRQGALSISGNADASLDGWKLTGAGALSGTMQAEGAAIGKLLRDAGRKERLDGLARAQVRFRGTADSPEATLQVTVEKPLIGSESFDRFTGEILYAPKTIGIRNGVLTAGGNRLVVGGDYAHPFGDFLHGQLRLTASTEGWPIEGVRTLQESLPRVAGRVSGKLEAEAAIQNGVALPQDVSAVISIQDFAAAGQTLGNVTLTGDTAGKQLKVAMKGDLRGTPVKGNAHFELSGDYPGSGEIDVASLRLSTVQDLLLTADTARAPVGGSFDTHLTFSGPLLKPVDLRAQIEIPRLQIAPARRTMNDKQRAELALHNQGPVVVDYDGRTVGIRSAHLVGLETDLQASGAISFRERSPLDLRLSGNLNLGVLQDFEGSLVSSGTAVVSATVRGSFGDPQLTGRMELAGASLAIADFPNGLDQLSGAVVFDQRRATIEKLTAKTGGGDLELTGFVGLGRSELLYRLQARADRVRLRYPEGVSATANATLSLTGTSARSLLSGVVTVSRAGLNLKSDIGAMLASAPAPVATAGAGSEFLRRMTLDIRVETVPNLQFQTTLTADIQADADLRIRGTAAKMTVLGRVVVSRGEIEFFGNKYSITRGEIGFFNPLRIEPLLDVNVETRARGVEVAISLNGTPNHMNFSYRSDPPLQSNEIIALLAMGRAPGSNSSLASSQTVQSSGILASGTNSLLGQAVTTPVSDRLQRFFGVSRLKIDPQLTGLSAVPQARLTIEQQVSRDITLTYVSNLSQANQQIIRLEWNLSRTWSVVAVREANGVFGVDFFFKKQVR